MKKIPVGWFTDPTSNTLIAILARDDESPQDAISRVAAAHGVQAADVSLKMPASGEGASVAVDVPSSAEPRSNSRASERIENPAHAVSRFADRARNARAMRPIEAPIVESLLPGGGGRPS